MNFSVKNTKYPAAIAPAIGNPSSATNLKKSPMVRSLGTVFSVIAVY
jgi:hypothetical protein